MTKKLALFNTIQNRVKKGFDDLVSETEQFADLGAESIMEDKNELQKKLDFVQDQFKRLEEELENQAMEINADQLSGCSNSVESLRTNINTQASTARRYIRDFIKKSKMDADAKAAQERVDAERAQVGRPERPTFNKELKPKMVPNGNFTMSELRNWGEDFETYFKSNRIAETHGVKESRIFLKNALEANLAKELFERITDDNAPVLGGEGSGSKSS